MFRAFQGNKILRNSYEIGALCSWTEGRRLMDVREWNELTTDGLDDCTLFV